MKNLYEKICSVKQSANVSTDQMERRSSMDDDEDFDLYLDTIQNANHVPKANPVSSIHEKLYNFYGVRESCQTNLFCYWEQKKDTDPELYSLATATVERCFSSLPIVLTSRRSRLGSDFLKDILITRLNFEILPHTYPDNGSSSIHL